jgi:hypothetical protein
MGCRSLSALWGCIFVEGLGEYLMGEKHQHLIHSTEPARYLNTTVDPPVAFDFFLFLLVTELQFPVADTKKNTFTSADYKSHR